MQPPYTSAADAINAAHTTSDVTIRVRLDVIVQMPAPWKICGTVAPTKDDPGCVLYEHPARAAAARAELDALG